MIAGKSEKQFALIAAKRHRLQHKEHEPTFNSGAADSLMNTSDPFSYQLPAERIAQRPVTPREAARLLVVRRSDGSIAESTFASIGDYLTTGDTLVFNETKVQRARVFASKLGHARQIEFLLLRRVGAYRWECLARPMRVLVAGDTLQFSPLLCARVIEKTSAPRVVIEFEPTFIEQEFWRRVEECGVMPIPPYIRKGRADAKDIEDYQSLFAAIPGSVAAPTASLHFSQSLIDTIRTGGVGIERVVLHVGEASFLPVRLADGTLRSPASETYEISSRTQAMLQAPKGRVIPVGTTVCRALESYARTGIEGASTDLFIQPPYSFHYADGLITNFHQPGTTHLYIVEALLGRSLLEHAYRYALDKDFRFLSYGDGMLIL